jgi:hypothetical protein
MVNRVNNTNVKLKRFMTRSVLTNNLKNSIGEYSVKPYQWNSVSDSHQSIDITHCQLTDNENNMNNNEKVFLIPSQSNPNSNQRNFCITNLHDKNNLTIFHRNICGIRNKTNEILCHFLSEFPRFLCITEHHLSVSEIHSVHIDNYTLGAYYCRNHMLKGGVCVYL